MHMVPPNKNDVSNKIQKLPYEAVLKVKGVVLPRPEFQCNKKMNTGDIEVQIESLEVLNSSMPQLPFSIRSFHKAKESLQMQYRYLALRFPELQRNLRIRSWVTMKMREYLIYQCGFCDIATPTLFCKTSGGAQEFIVPTKHAGKFYSLVQSPQQFKQLLMVGGLDKYFQIAQCYRDEGSRHDRQPEFTQLDIEMSFIDRKSIMEMTENVILNSWPEFLGKIKTPFDYLTYEEAMEKYGTDCPDLRIPGQIHNISSIIKSIDTNFNQAYSIYATVFSGKQQHFTNSTKKKLNQLSKQMFQRAKFIQLKVNNLNMNELQGLFSEDSRRSIVENLSLAKDDILLLTYGPKLDARQLLGRIRIEFVNIIESRNENEKIRSSEYKFVWILDFPLFTFNNEKNILEATHHPFTQPHPQDMKYLNTDPTKVRGLQYDLVMNGSEIGGGSIRIHQRKLQEQILEMLNIDSSKMYYLLDALDSGAPPHGGIAIGLDRYISLICKASSIREVIAFPKTMEGRDLMSDAPTSISEEDKKLYHIQVIDNQ
ncbi:aspartate--tRNA ligase, mitochondrial isoform X2 [Phymastichus coffea]|uniref:aspartate--tRNA ligase, mitochondrial isoform X2 n=1 Tax=Phymastichus coffea TaxID=108790 RepID=UPI00273AF0A5|nr:aspartate--tRNA ligase, mitochondrial isoform X2 [Phymastichus coffea]